MNFFDILCLEEHVEVFLDVVESLHRVVLFLGYAELLEHIEMGLDFRLALLGPVQHVEGPVAMVEHPVDVFDCLGILPPYTEVGTVTLHGCDDAYKVARIELAVVRLVAAFEKESVFAPSVVELAVDFVFQLVEDFLGLLGVAEDAGVDVDSHAEDDAVVLVEGDEVASRLGSFGELVITQGVCLAHE